MGSQKTPYPIFVVRALLLGASFSQFWAALGPQNQFPPSGKAHRRIGGVSLATEILKKVGGDHLFAPFLYRRPCMSSHYSYWQPIWNPYVPT